MSNTRGTSTEPGRRLLTITAAAQELGIARGTVHALLDAGQLGYLRIGSDRRILLSEIDAFIERNVVRKKDAVK